MFYASLGARGWYIHRENGGDMYLTPIAGPLTKAEAEAWVREASPTFWQDHIVVGENYIGVS